MLCAHVLCRGNPPRRTSCVSTCYARPWLNLLCWCILSWPFCHMLHDPAGGESIQALQLTVLHWTSARIDAPRCFAAHSPALRVHTTQTGGTGGSRVDGGVAGWSGALWTQHTHVCVTNTRAQLRRPCMHPRMQRMCSTSACVWGLACQAPSTAAAAAAGAPHSARHALHLHT